MKLTPVIVPFVVILIPAFGQQDAKTLIALAHAGESVLDVLERFKPQWPEIAAGLRYCSKARSDWQQPIERVLAVMEGVPLLQRHGVA